MITPSITHHRPPTTVINKHNTQNLLNQCTYVFMYHSHKQSLSFFMCNTFSSQSILPSCFLFFSSCFVRDECLVCTDILYLTSISTLAKLILLFTSHLFSNGRLTTYVHTLTSHLEALPHAINRFLDWWSGAKGLVHINLQHKQQHGSLFWR